LKLSVWGAEFLDNFQFAVINAHHSRADAETPAMPVGRRRTDSRIRQRLFRGREREAVRTRGEA
jgi:hypothetical protein